MRTGSLDSIELYWLHHWISCLRADFSAQKGWYYVKELGWFRMLSDSNKAPGWRAGPENRGFVIQFCGWIIVLRNETVNSDSTVMVPHCAVNSNNVLDFQS